MNLPHAAQANQFAIVKFKEPVLFTRSEEETWVLNPPRRYILNVSILGSLQQYVDGVSDLKSANYYKPLLAGPGQRLPGSRILVERFRERGVGDLLFLTGPMEYLMHLSGRNLHIDFYALAERGMILQHHTALAVKTTLAGPVLYDDLPLYDYHWFVDTVTEYDEEFDQLNVYDALFKQLGLNPDTIDPKYKRPTAYLSDQDFADLDMFMAWVWEQKRYDLRKTGYYVVAPFCHGSLRAGVYGMWLETITQLSQIKPVVVVGQIKERMPSTDMTAGEFIQKIDTCGGNVINAVGVTSIRVLMALISKATAVTCLDSAPLYIAQAFRTPAISIWGPHHPGVRIGYDQPYMESAIWDHSACRYCPCFAYAEFPVKKCPRGASQTLCEVTSVVLPSMIVDKIKKIENKLLPLPSFKAANP